jgi:hypothetical protein
MNHCLLAWRAVELPYGAAKGLMAFLKQMNGVL